MRELELLSKKHDKWISLVKGFGCNNNLAEDVVQDAYIRIWEYVSKGTNIDYGDDDVNDFYMYMTLRSIYFNSIKRKKVLIYKPVDTSVLDSVLSSIKDEYSDVEMEGAYSRLVNKINKEVNTWSFYERNLFIAYFTSSKSLDAVSKDSMIGRSSVYNTLKKHRQVIKDMFGEDAQDFFNKDYNLIK